MVDIKHVISGAFYFAAVEVSAYVIGNVAGALANIPVAIAAFSFGYAHSVSVSDIETLVNDLANKQQFNVPAAAPQASNFIATVTQQNSAAAPGVNNPSAPIGSKVFKSDKPGYLYMVQVADGSMVYTNINPLSS